MQKWLKQCYNGNCNKWNRARQTFESSDTRFRLLLTQYTFSEGGLMCYHMTYVC